MDYADEVPIMAWLGEKAKNAALIDGFDCGWEIGLAGEKDPHCPGAVSGNPGQKICATQSGHVLVTNEHVDWPSF